jgi:MFS family permease
MPKLSFAFQRPNGMRGFFMIWLGQVVSGIASGITAVALPIWIFSITESGAAVGLLEFFFFACYLVSVPFAGIIIDRSDRKAMMLVSDFLSLAGLVILLLLQSVGALEVWHLYISAAFQGVGSAFQSPSYAAAITTMVSKKQYVRANSLLSLLYEIPGIFGPILAGVMYLVIGLSGILAINLLAFVVSIAVLLFVEVPPPPKTAEGLQSHKKFLDEAFYGIKYIFRRPNLLGLQLIFLTGNLFSGIALSTAVLYPMVLLRTGNDTQILGTVQSAAALASVLGGVFLTAWGAIRRPARAIILGWIISSLFGMTLLGIGQTLWIWLIAVLVDAVFDPIVNVSMDSFLQSKVPPDLQGRVFSASDFLAQAMLPFTPLLAGYFGDRILEPAMGTGGALANMFGWLVGTGPGSGFGLLIVLCGVGGALIGIAGYLIPSIRRIDILIPDFQRLTMIGMLRRMPALRTRKHTRKTRRSIHKRVRVRASRLLQE